MKAKTILAQNIQTLRQEKGWTQEELAERLGCSFDTVQSYECCKREPACKVMVALEQIFGVTGAQLYGLELLPQGEPEDPAKELPDKQTSRGLEAFLAYLREAGEEYRMAETDRVEAEAATQDLLHALELGEDSAAGRAKLAEKLREVRQQRRRAKDTAERTAPVAEWAEQNRTVIKGLKRLLGDVRKVERKGEKRTYTPRTHVLEELEGRE